MFEACKVGSQNAKELLDYIISAVERPHSRFELLELCWLSVMPVNEKEITLFCKLCETLQEEVNFHSDTLEKWLRACFRDDVKELIPCLMALDEKSQIFPFCIKLAIDLALVKNLPTTLHVLRNFLIEDKHAELRADLDNWYFDILKTSAANEFSVRNIGVRLASDLTGDVPGDNYLKPYWVDSFVDIFTFTPEQYAWLSVAKSGDRAAAYSLLVSKNFCDPLFLELIVLVALRHDNVSFAEACAQALPVCRGDQWGIQKLFLRWIFFWALHRGCESICESLIKLHNVERAFDFDSPMGGEVLCTKSLSSKGFILAGLLKSDKRDTDYWKRRAFLVACWQQDEEAFRLHKPPKIERGLLVWAFLTGRVHLIKYILDAQESLYHDILSNRAYYTQLARNYPDVAVGLARMFERARAADAGSII